MSAESKPRFVKTEDGSITCYDAETGELFHNRAGAYAEALRNFVEPAGLIQLCLSQPEVSFLDVPFGLAYNCFVFLQMLLELPAEAAIRRVQIVGIEIDPYIMSVLGHVLADEKFARLSGALPNPSQFLETLSHFEAVRISINKIDVHIWCRQGDIRVVVPCLVQEGIHFDAVLHDPFSPSKMPELWTYDLFFLYVKLLKDSGRILTYSSADAVRSALQQCGLHIYRTAALGGKSGGTMASTVAIEHLPSDVYQLSSEETARLSSRSGVCYTDPDLQDSRESILKRRAQQKTRQ